MTCTHCHNASYSTFSSRPTPEGVDNYVICPNCGHEELYNQLSILGMED